MDLQNVALHGASNLDELTHLALELFAEEQAKRPRCLMHKMTSLPGASLPGLFMPSCASLDAATTSPSVDSRTSPSMTLCVESFQHLPTLPHQTSNHLWIPLPHSPTTPLLWPTELCKTPSSRMTEHLNPPPFPYFRPSPVLRTAKRLTGLNVILATV